MDKRKLTAYKKRLLEMRAELSHLSEVTRDGRKPVELDQTSVGRLSRMDALQTQSMQLETERRRGIELQRVEAALKRIENDDFGYCVSCGEDIEEKRLTHNPTFPTCIDCAQSPR